MAWLICNACIWWHTHIYAYALPVFLFLANLFCSQKEKAGVTGSVCDFRLENSNINLKEIGKHSYLWLKDTFSGF